MAKKDLKNNLTKMNKTPSRATVGKLAELLERQDIDINQIGGINKISVYQSITKDAEGEPHVHDLMGIQISPQWETGPEWPVIQPRKRKRQHSRSVLFFPTCRLVISATRKGI